jgi:hypothetical protein
MELPNIVRVFKSRKKMSWTCSMYGRTEKLYTGFRWGNLREIDHLEDPGLDGRIILSWIFRKWMDGSIWLRIGTVGGHL